MTATTEFYITLQNIYLQKATDDLALFTTFLHQIMSERSVPHDRISPDQIRLFCQNVQTLEVTRIQSIKKELASPSFDDIANEFYDEDSSVKWFVMVRAVEQFRDKSEGRYPGTTEGQDDFPALRAEVDSIMSQIAPMDDGSLNLEDKYVKEMIRFGDSKLHKISAFLGGVASQEAIKVLIRQYTPMNHALVYDGIHAKAQVFNTA